MVSGYGIWIAWTLYLLWAWCLVIVVVRYGKRVDELRGAFGVTTNKKKSPTAFKLQLGLLLTAAILAGFMAVGTLIYGPGVRAEPGGQRVREWTQHPRSPEAEKRDTSDERNPG